MHWQVLDQWGAPWVFSEDDDHIDDNVNDNDGAKRDTDTSSSSGRRRSADRHELTVTASINANNPQVCGTQ